MMTYCDWSGRTMARYFIRNGEEVALCDDGYTGLRRLIEKVLRAKPFSSGLSEDFVEEETFRWWRNSLRNETEKPLSLYLLDAAEDVVAEHEFLVPISAIEIERPFILGDVLITPFDKLLLDNFGERAAEKNPESAELIRKKRAELRRELGHLTAVSVRVVGDRQFVKERAQEAAFDIAAILRFMCPAAVSWNVTFACYPKGCEHIRSTTLIEIRDRAISTLSQTIIDIGMFNWKLSFAELNT